MEEEWETQQIRKGVTGAQVPGKSIFLIRVYYSFDSQIAAVQQDSMIQQQPYSMVSVEMVMMPAPPPPPMIQPPDPTKVIPTTPSEVLNKMKER